MHASERMNQHAIHELLSTVRTARLRSHDISMPLAFVCIGW